MNSIADITRESKAITVYLLKVNGFTNTNSYRAIKSGSITINNVIDDFQNFVKNLKNEVESDLKHLRYLKLENVDRSQFKFSLSERADLIGTIDSIIAKKCIENSNAPAISQSHTRSNLSNNPEISIPNLQAFVNKNLHSLMAQYGQEIQDFPIIKYSLDAFPYKITNKCPFCPKEVTWNISLDTKPNGKKYITARRYMFETHIKTHVLPPVQN